MAVESEGFETAVEFPGGRVENPVEIPKDQLGKAAEARLGDARFVLDELGRRGWNLDKVGMFGHSFGGFTASLSTCPNAGAWSTTSPTCRRQPVSAWSPEPAARPDRPRPERCAESSTTRETSTGDLDHGFQREAVVDVGGGETDDEGQSVRVRQDVHLGPHPGRGLLAGALCRPDEPLGRGGQLAVYVARCRCTPGCSGSQLRPTLAAAAGAARAGQ